MGTLMETLMGGSFGAPETLNGYVNGYVNGDLNGWLLGGQFGAGFGGLQELHFGFQLGTKNWTRNGLSDVVLECSFFRHVARSGVLKFWCQTNGAGASAEPATARRTEELPMKQEQTALHEATADRPLVFSRAGWQTPGLSWQSLASACAVVSGALA